jgi:hypothetical protein
MTDIDYTSFLLGSVASLIFFGIVAILTPREDTNRTVFNIVISGCLVAPFFYWLGQHFGWVS